MMFISAFSSLRSAVSRYRDGRSRRYARRRKPGLHRFRGRLQLELFESRDLLSGVWTQLTNLAPSDTGTSTMLLLSDGTVMVQGGGTETTVTKTWYRLTPDATGSYANGTWSQLASMGLEREWYASNVLPDGRVLVVGGEDSGPQGQMNFTNTGEIYDPTADAWTPIRNFPARQFGDDPSEELPDGRVLAGYLLGGQTYIYNPASDSWNFAAFKARNDRSDEETWVKLPDDSILSYDVFDASATTAHAQRYLPAQNQWVDAGDVPVILSNSDVGFELGPAFLLPDGRVFYLGATGHTAYYDPATNSWTAGPDIPDGMGAGDVPGAMMPNGHILFAADPMPFFSPPTTIYEFDPTTNTYTDVTPADYDLSLRPADDRMLVLPSGQILLTNESDQLIVYTPDGSPDPSWKPIINHVHNNRDGTYRLVGRQLNGISEGASYGDDAEMSSNYPIVQLTDRQGNVFYARTFNWDSTGVATGDLSVSTEFTLPAGIHPGRYTLSVIANGIASDPVEFRVHRSGLGTNDAPARSAEVAEAIAGIGITPPAPGTLGTGVRTVAITTNDANPGVLRASTAGRREAAGSSGVDSAIETASLGSTPIRAVLDDLFAVGALAAPFDDGM